MGMNPLRSEFKRPWENELNSVRIERDVGDPAFREMIYRKVITPAE